MSNILLHISGGVVQSITSDIKDVKIYIHEQDEEIQSRLRGPLQPDTTLSNEDEFKAELNSIKAENLKDGRVGNLYKVATNLMSSSINNHGPLKYSQRNYESLCDLLTEVEVGFFGFDAVKVESDYGKTLIDMGFVMDEETAYTSLSNIINSISRQIDYIPFDSDSMIEWAENHHKICVELQNTYVANGSFTWGGHEGEGAVLAASKELTDQFVIQNWGIQWGVDKDFEDTLVEFIEKQSFYN
ncbi:MULTISPECIES: hypothetical protein [unclassified Paraflavitalea]|uniref:hypothetical protein n=1 Tax=unclassified Paraflavitalea TaxID=2798305 RepID=UPI003D3365E8